MKFSGKSGWVLSKYVTITPAPTAVKPTPAPVAAKSITSPQIVSSGKDTYLNWTKLTNFSFKYTTSANQLTLKQGFTAVQLPAVKVKGIKEIKTVQASSTEKSVVITFEPGYTFTLRNYSNKVSLKVIPTGLLGKKIIIDAGHGGKDTGAIGPTGYREKDATLAISLALQKELQKAGAIVTLTRSTDIFLELSERTAISNKSDYDAFVCIHADSFTTESKGTTTYYNSTLNFNGPKSITLASNVQKNLIGTVKTYDRGIKEQDYYVNRMNELPSILVETAFISNPTEEALLKSPSFRQNTAVGIRKGLESYFIKL
ncbi:N-acetylmuramoyl-L-alanine amidase [Bacillus sp. C11]|nr:N-acetylmuramoyl-L-alanine amidase [Neobacillus terrae]